MPHVPLRNNQEHIKLEEKQSTSPSRVQVHRQRSPFAGDDAASPSRANRDRASVAMASRNFTRVVLSPERQRADCEAFNHHAHMVAMDFDAEMREWEREQNFKRAAVQANLKRLKQIEQQVGLQDSPSRPSSQQTMMDRSVLRSPQPVLPAGMPMHPSERMPRSPSPAKRISRGIAEHRRPSPPLVPMHRARMLRK